MPRTPQKSRRPASVPSAHHRRAASHASGLAGDGRATRAGGGGGGGGSALSLTPATPQNTAAAAAARQYRHTDEPPRQGRLSRMYLASLPRPRLGAMTAYLARTEQRMQQKREAAELDHAKRTIIDALDLAQDGDGAQDGRYRRLAGDARASGEQRRCLHFKCVSRAGVTRNLEATVKCAVLHCYQPGEVVEVFELCRTAEGRPRARTSRGWVSVISQNGTRLLKQLDHDPTEPANASGGKRQRTPSPRGREGERQALMRGGAAARSDALAPDGGGGKGVRALEWEALGSESRLDDSVSDSVSIADSEYWSAEEELEEELRDLEVDDTHASSAWGGESIQLDEQGEGGVTEVSGEGGEHPVSKEHPRITEQHMTHEHKFEWERSLASYLWRMVNDEMDGDFGVKLRTEEEQAEDWRQQNFVPEAGTSAIEFRVEIAIPRLLQWIAGRKVCELSERCIVDWSQRRFTVECRTLNWTDSFNVFEHSIYGAQPGAERTDFVKVLRIEQFKSFPPPWVVNWVRDRWALVSRKGRVQVDEIAEKTDLTEASIRPCLQRLGWQQGGGVGREQHAGAV